LGHLKDIDAADQYNVARSIFFGAGLYEALEQRTKTLQFSMTGKLT
jgi:hypothetical protein